MSGPLRMVAVTFPRRMLPLPADEVARLDRGAVRRSAALAARSDSGARLPADSRRRTLQLQIHAFLEERLGDPGLSPGGVAAAHFISVRYLHKLFETEQTTVADWIRSRRLERCRRDLLDPALSTRTVEAIGERWGLTDAAHFSRVFKRRFGVPPAEYRLLHTPRR